jgi:hypothetical protein
LTRIIGLSEDESHAQASLPQHRIQAQVAQEFVAGEILRHLANRHDISGNLIRVWVARFDARRKV